MSFRQRQRVRTPQACERCRRNKTKCDGNRPRCSSCVKRNVICSWAELANSTATYITTSSPEPQRSQGDCSTQTSTLVRSQSNKPDFVLPEFNLMQLLFNIFFERHHDSEFSSFFHTASLEISTLYEKSPFLTTSVMSLSALYVSANQAAVGFGFDTPQKLSHHYAYAAKCYARTVYDEPSVSNVQSYLILSLRELLTWSKSKAYMYAGVAVRMAQAMDMNVEVGKRYPVREKEIRRRTFWACFIMDRLISYSCNKPFALPYQSIDIHLPCPDNHFAFDERYKGLTIHDMNLQGYQLSRLGIRPLFIATLRLWGDVALLHVSGGRKRSKYGPRAPQSEFYRLEKAIDRFTTVLPSSLEWSTPNYKLHHATRQAQMYVNLLFMLHHSKCVMHQEYLPQLDSQYSLDNGAYSGTSFDAAGISLDHEDQDIVKICLENINVITDMATTLDAGASEERRLLQSVFAANAVLTAAAVHLWVLYTQTCDACPKHEALTKAERLRQVIKSWQSEWPVATAWVETLEMLYKLYVYSYGKIVNSDLDCWDIGEDISAWPSVAEEVVGDSGLHPAILEEDIQVDSLIGSHQLHDRIRAILVDPLLVTNVKQRNLRTYCRTLWQHLWTYDFGGDSWDAAIPTAAITPELPFI